MRQIIVGFSSPKKWKPFAELIKFGYGIPYDHVYIKYRDDYYNRDVIYQASSTMVNFMSPTIFEQNNKIIQEFTLNITDENHKSMVCFAMDNAGKPYGIKECFGLAWVRINKIFGKNIKNPFASNGATYVCCQMADAIIQQFADVQVPYDLGSIDPKELYDFLSQVLGKVA